MTPDAHMASAPVSITPDGAKIPVVATVLDAFGDVWSHRGAAVRISATWGILLAVVGLASFGLIIGAQSTLEMSPWVTLAAVWMPTIFYVLLAISAAVGWHRHVLLGENPARVYLRFDRTVWRYLAASLLLGLVVGLVSAIAAVPAVVVGTLVLGSDPSQWNAGKIVIAVLLGLAVYLPTLLFTMRLSIALPARAIGEPMRLREAMAATSGNSWRILAGMALISVPMIVVHAIMNLLLDFQVRMPGGELNWVGILSFLVLMAVALTALIAMTLVSVGYISLAYRFFAERRPAAPMATAS